MSNVPSWEVRKWDRELRVHCVQSWQHVHKARLWVLPAVRRRQVRRRRGPVRLYRVRAGPRLDWWDGHVHHLRAGPVRRSLGHDALHGVPAGHGEPR